MIRNTLTYKGYTGTVECSEEDDCLFGHIVGIRGYISYEGYSFKELKEDFHDAVDDYLEMCEAYGKKPEVPYKGSFNVRISPELHRNIAVYAINHNKSLNSVIEDTLEKAFA